MGGAGDDLKKDFKNMIKHFKKMIKGFFSGNHSIGDDQERQSGCGSGCRPGPNQWARPGGFPPFFPFRYKFPIMLLCYPKIVVGTLILIALLFCGVSLYGLIVIILLILLFILI